MIEFKDLTKEEKSLLLFLEVCIVDRACIVNTVHMNEEDMYIAKKWDRDGLIQFGRVWSTEVKEGRTHYVIFSERAFELAHQERKERGERQRKEFFKRCPATVEGRGLK